MYTPESRNFGWDRYLVALNLYNRQSWFSLGKVTACTVQTATLSFAQYIPTAFDYDNAQRCHRHTFQNECKETLFASNYQSLSEEIYWR